MSPKVLYVIGATVGGTLGAYVPSLWHGSEFSGAGILCSTIGGVLGVLAVYKYLVA